MHACASFVPLVLACACSRLHYSVPQLLCWIDVYGRRIKRSMTEEEDEDEDADEEKDTLYVAVSSSTSSYSRPGGRLLASSNRVCRY